MNAIDWSSTRTASEGHATVGAAAVLRLVPHRPVKWVFDPFVDERYAITRGLSPVACLLSRGDCPRLLAFCPNGAQGDSPGQRPVGWNVEIESRPEGAELNGAEIKASTYPGRRFALPWAISFCPFGAEK